MINPKKEEVQIIAKKIKDITNYNTYIVGSYCINNIKSNDIDIVIFLPKLNPKKYREIKHKINNINPIIQMIPNKETENIDKELPYWNLQDLNDYKIVNKKDYTEEEYNILKQNMHFELFKRQDYLKEWII